MYREDFTTQNRQPKGYPLRPDAVSTLHEAPAGRISIPRLHKSFSKVMQMVSSSHGLDQVFSDFLEMTVCSFQMGADEEHYFRTIKRYKTPQLYNMAEALAYLIIEMDGNGTGYVDVLGGFFEEYISHGHNGQFFTPMPICEMMARLQGPIEPGAVIADCACGSGRTLMAAASLQPAARFFAADVSRNCALMTAINFCLNGMFGEVNWMDSLSNHWYGGWRIELHPTGLTPYLRKITEDESFMLLRLPELPPAAGPVQLALEF